MNEHIETRIIDYQESLSDRMYEHPSWEAEKPWIKHQANTLWSQKLKIKIAVQTGD